MNTVNVNFENKGIKLSEIEIGKTFKIGDIVYIKFADVDGETTAVTKDILFTSEFGDNNNFKESTVFEKLNNEFLHKVAELIGYENICNISTDLTTLDGLNPYGTMTSKISLPTFDFYRANVEIFDKYKLDEWWWLATPDSAQPHYSPVWVTCVSPRGNFNYYYYYCNFGVRPLLRFVSSISVSCED